MSQGGEDRYWKRTSSLMWLMMGLWIFFSFGATCKTQLTK